MPAEDASVVDTIDDPRAPADQDLERIVAFEAIRAQLFAGPRQPVSIGRFTITQRVGQGGMGTVYAAFDPQLERKVAIKVVRELGGDQQEIERARRSLEREARAAAGLTHPNVVTVYESGRHGDGFYVAMEFVEGRTLRQWLELRRRSWQEIVTTFIGAGRGLQAAHAAGLVHCDFKPGNVLIGRDDRPQVADFGLVRWVESRSEPSMELSPSHTMEGSPGTLQTSIAGTPRYMAPEQRRGLSISPRCDQFSYCVALYEALLGALPYERDEAMDFEQPGALGRAHVGVRLPRRLVRALLVGLALAPERRHPTMSALVDELERALASRRRRKWWALGAVLAAATGGLGYAMAGDPIDPCEGAAAELEEVWSEPVRQRVRDQLRATGSEAMAARVTGLIDEYGQAWGAMRRASCEATHHRGTQSMDLFELRSACLDRRRYTLENLVGRMQEGDEALLGQATTLVEGMTPVEECEADFVRANVMTNAAASRNDLSRSPETDATSRAAYRTLSDAQLRIAEGHADEALVMLQEVETRAQEAGLRQLQSIAIRLQVDQQMLEGVPERAVERLQSALALAIEAGDHGGAALTVARILKAHREGATDPIDPSLLLALGRAWARKSTRPVIHGIELELEAASMALASGRWQDALDVLERCAARLRASDSADHSIAYRVQMLRGDALLEAGRLDEAAAVLTDLRDRLRERLEPRHVMVADADVTLGAVRRLQGDLAGAKALYLDAREIYVDRLSPDSPRAALVSSELAGVYKGLGDFDAAREAFERSIATSRRIHGRDDANLAISLNQLAELEYEMEAFDDGLAHARAAVELANASFGERHVYTAAFKNTVGKLELATGHVRDAVTTLGDALATLSGDEQVNPAWSGEVAFFLAKATLELDSTRRAEAAALSDQALADFGRAQGEEARRFVARITEWRSAQGLEDARQ
ncbi:serine/threonine-protein kinase [Paraliomyxa miuraensis]|uniref:serine/threonine-protein kinase n=1 Tax=Paraliomyxa miuraensis TaxID=376150 RepID=UPI0022595AB8|nr:serine/threonine-protein kinase [Paraliomyxa miuraensis]MCX4239476.1 serine/threonine-protein kinase [Paraliomyxa miuraensis]